MDRVPLSSDNGTKASSKHSTSQKEKKPAKEPTTSNSYSQVQTKRKAKPPHAPLVEEKRETTKTTFFHTRAESSLCISTHFCIANDNRSKPNIVVYASTHISA